MQESDWDHVLDVNLKGTFLCAQAGARAMVAAGRRGAIVNLSSSAIRGDERGVHYSASKAGVLGLTRAMALALAPHDISVGTVAPGFVQTEMARDALQGERGDAVRAQSPFGRVARPEEVAAAVLWLASPEARFASGTIVDVNGASYLRS
jgi:NAD(P)-dependent dehydrogenase (short-subunit alcohol dehydrogenase family)